MPNIVNNINLTLVEESRDSFVQKENGHHYIEKKIEGEFRLEGSPSFSARLQSEKSSYVLGADEPTILEGEGIQISPLTYVLYGIMACYANTLAIQCGLKDVRLAKLKLVGHLYYDIGPMLSNIDSPLINELRIEVDADKDIREIIEVSRVKCPAVSLVEKSVKTAILQV